MAAPVEVLGIKLELLPTNLTIGDMIHTIRCAHVAFVPLQEAEVPPKLTTFQKACDP
jgi:hypothetical protein